MKFLNIWLLLLITARLSSMEQQAPISNYEITTLPDQTKLYKCLLCNYRPVSRECTFLTHWVKNHNQTFDYTMEIWKEVYLQCPTCLTYHSTPSSLRCHTWRHHRNPETAPRKTNRATTIESLERKAAHILHALSTKIADK